jgi:hypothetical protein
VLNQLGRSTAPNIKITFGDVVEPELLRLAAGCLETRGVSDQTKHAAR